MSEIVVVEPIFHHEIHFEQGETSTARQQHHDYDDAMSITNVSSNSVDYAVQQGPFDSERLPTVFASEIQRFLRVANLLEREEPRVAYLCKSFFLLFFIKCVWLIHFC